MKTDPKTGELVLTSGLVLSPQLTYSAFIASVNGAQATVVVNNDPWRSLRFEETDESLIVIVFFKGEILESVELSITGPEFGTQWQDWSEEKELDRKKANDQWLKNNRLVPNTSYAWGEIWSDYDPRSGSSSIVIRYRS